MGTRDPCDVCGSETRESLTAHVCRASSQGRCCPCMVEINTGNTYLSTSRANKISPRARSARSDPATHSLAHSVPAGPHRAEHNEIQETLPRGGAKQGRGLMLSVQERLNRDDPFTESRPDPTRHRTEKAGRFAGKGEGLAGDVAPRT